MLQFVILAAENVAVLSDPGATPPCQLDPTLQMPSAAAIHVKAGFAPNVHLTLLPEFKQPVPAVTLVALIFSESLTSVYVMVRVLVGLTNHLVPLEVLTMDTGFAAVPVNVQVPLMI